MVITKALLAEQIQRIVNGGFPSDRDRVLVPEIKLAIADVCNYLLKAEIYNVAFNFDNGSVIEGSAVATYENIPVVRGVPYGNIITATAAMPSTPMMMPDQMGVFGVYPTGRPHLAYRYIPSGLVNLWMDNRMVNVFHRRFFTWDSNKITIFDDVRGLGFDEIDVKLIISPVDTAGDNDPLPVPPELRDRIVTAVVARFMQEPETNREETDEPSPSKSN
jgi:hypothetical protein